MKAAGEGVWISLDNVQYAPGSSGNIEFYADRINELKTKGFLDKVLISHDAGWYDPAKPQGGTYRGYNDIFDHLVPALKARGFSEEDLDQILAKNPQKAFTVKIRKH
jgi:phosphotriesterase-related protein